MAKKKSFHVHNKEEKVSKTLDVLNEDTMDHLRKRNSYLFSMLLNLVGTILWSYYYFSDIYTYWWVLVLAGLSALAAIGWAIRLFRHER